MKGRGKIEPFRSMKVANVTRYHLCCTRCCAEFANHLRPKQTWCVLVERGDYEANPSNYRITLVRSIKIMEFGEADKRCLPHFLGGSSRSEPQGRPRSRTRCDSLLHFWKHWAFSASLHGPGSLCFELAFVRQCATADRVSRVSAASITHAYHARSVCGLGNTSLDVCLDPVVVIGLNAVRCAVTTSSWPLEILAGLSKSNSDHSCSPTCRSMPK